MPKGLTAKQRDFVNFYTTLGSDTYNNAMQSALKAGYSKGMANLACRDILGNTSVQEAIDLRREEIKESSKVTLEEVTDNARWLVKHGKKHAKDTAVGTGNRQLGDIIGAFRGNDIQQAMQINITLPDADTAHKIECKAQTTNNE